jgi:hypothetical protein
LMPLMKPSNRTNQSQSNSETRVLKSKAGEHLPARLFF